MATFNNGESGLSVRTKINNVLQHTDGTASELVINEAGADVNFRVESDTNANALFVDGGTGNVGIGTSAPAKILELSEPTDGAALRISSRQNDSSHSTVNPFGAVEFYSQDGSGPGASVRARIGAQFLDASGATSGLTFSTSPSTGLAEAMRITSTGNVGIGTSSPSQRLDIVGDATSAAIELKNTAGQGLDLTGGSAGVDIRTPNALPMTFATSGTERMRLDASGNLHLAYAQSGPSAVVRFGGTNGFAQIEGVGTTTTGGLVFKTLGGSFAERMRIASTGNVGIGTSSPDTLLHLAGADTAVIRLENTDTTLTTDQVIGAIEFEKQDASGGGAGVVGGIQMLSADASGTNTKLLFNIAAGAINDLNVFSLDVSEVVVNEPGNDYNFRVESDTNTHAFFVDGGTSNVGIGTTAPTNLLDVNADSIRVRTAQTPATAGAAGNQGEIAWDADYIYVCVATNTWKRVAIATW